MRLTVDDTLCTGHGRCYALAPEVFEPAEFGHCAVRVPGGGVPDGLEAQARTGRDNCPEGAITVA
jgi:ferredoxin